MNAISDKKLQAAAARSKASRLCWENKEYRARQTEAIREGIRLNRALHPNAKTVEVDGVTYASIAEAERRTPYSYRTLLRLSKKQR